MAPNYTTTQADAGHTAADKLQFANLPYLFAALFSSLLFEYLTWAKYSVFVSVQQLSDVSM